MIVNALDPDNLEANKNCRIFLNGVELKAVSYADSETGIVVYYHRSKDGQYHSEGGEIMSVIDSGRVLIVPAGAKVDGE